MNLFTSKRFERQIHVFLQRIKKWQKLNSCTPPETAVIVNSILDIVADMSGKNVCWDPTITWYDPIRQSAALEPTLIIAALVHFQTLEA